MATVGAALSASVISQRSCLQKVDNYEYELPSDFEDEEIDEDLAFTEEDKQKYAGWFEQAAADAQLDRQQNKRHRGEYAELDSSSQEEADEDEVRLLATAAAAL